MNPADYPRHTDGLIGTCFFARLAPGTFLRMDDPHLTPDDSHDHLFAGGCPGPGEIGIDLLVDGTGNGAVPAPFAESRIYDDMKGRCIHRLIPFLDIEDSPGSEHILGTCLDTEAAPDAVPKIYMRYPKLAFPENIDGPGCGTDHAAGKAVGAEIFSLLRKSPEMRRSLQGRGLHEEELLQPLAPGEFLQIPDDGYTHGYLSLHAIQGSELIYVAVISAAESTPLIM